MCTLVNGRYSQSTAERLMGLSLVLKVFVSKVTRWTNLNADLMMVLYEKSKNH